MSFKKSGYSHAIVVSTFLLMGVVGVYLMIDGQSYDRVSNNSAYQDAQNKTVGNVISAVQEEVEVSSSTEGIEEIATTTATSSEDVIEESEPLTIEEIAEQAVGNSFVEKVDEPEPEPEPVIEAVAESAAAGELDAAASSTPTTTPDIILENFPEFNFQATGLDIYKNVRSSLTWSVEDEELKCESSWSGEEIEGSGRQTLYFNIPGRYNFSVLCEKGSVGTIKSVSVLVRDSLDPDYDKDGYDYYPIDPSDLKIITEKSAQKPFFREEEGYYKEDGGVEYTWQLRNESKIHVGVSKIVARIHFRVLNDEMFEHFEEVLSQGQELGLLDERRIEYMGYIDTPSGGKVPVFEHTVSTKTIVPGAVSEKFDFLFGDWASTTENGVHYADVEWYKVYLNNGEVYVAN